VTEDKGGPAQHDHHEAVATLLRSVPVRLVEVSRGGIRFECASRVEAGTSGQIAVGLRGLMCVDDVRIARCQQRAGAGPTYNVGAELLRTRPLNRRSVRLAVRSIIGESGPADDQHRDRSAPPEGAPGTESAEGG